MTARVEIRNLRKAFRKTVAVDDLSFSIGPGELVGLIGPNGAGKSTTVKLLTGQLVADGGEIRVDGRDVLADPLAARRAIGYVPQDLALFPFLTGREVLAFVAEVRGVPPEVAGPRMEALLGRFGLVGAADRLTREYSEGMARKLAICAALLASPPLLVLDESLNGLDPRAAAEVKAVLAEELARGTAILLVSHILEVLERLCHRVILIEGGRAVATLDRAALEAMRAQGTSLEDFFIAHTRA